jgi:aminopeptidase N
MPGQNLTRAEAEARAALLDVTAYDIALDLTWPGERFGSVTRVAFDCRTPGAATFIDLIAPTVTGIILNGKKLDPASHFADSRIELPELQASNELVVEAEAEWSHTGEGLHRFTDPVDGNTYCYTQFEVADARRVFANFEQPDLKSHFTFHVTAPADWTVWSNQPVAQTSPGDGSTRWDFEASPRMSTYLTALVAGPYVAWTDSYRSLDERRIPLGVLVRPSMAEYMDAAEIFDITKRGFAFYERAFGVVFPYAKYDQAFVPEYNVGAMENIGLVTVKESYVFRSKPTQALVDRRAVTILHELAHMWFGDLVTMRWWDDLWLNESFAEFVTVLAQVANTRWTDGWVTFLASEKSWALNQDQLPSTHPIVADIRDLADVEVNFDGITYAKGASVLRQLVAWVGQDEFLACVSEYLKKHAWGNATLADLLAELEKASGRDLKDWSRQWLQEAGVTVLRPVVESASPRGLSLEADAGHEPAARDCPHPTITALTIHQEVPPVYADNSRDAGVPLVTPSLRPHRLAISGYGFGEAGLTQTWSVETDIAGAATPVAEAVGRPVPDLLLVNDRDLTYAKLRLDPASLATVSGRLADLHDPLARGLIWASLWDATRDGELAASVFAETVLNAIASETAPTTVQTLLSQLHTALAYYVAPARREALTAAAAGRLFALAQEDTPGSDNQLQFFKAFTALAAEPPHLDALLGVFHGAGTVPGLTVDTDLRWEILRALVAHGRLGEPHIAAELDRDPTTAGREHAAGAQAAIPQPQDKMAAWIAAVTDATMTNSTQRAVIAGFGQVPDRGLLTGFVAPYFAELESVWTTRSREMATNVVQGLYPMQSLNATDVVAATDAWLAQLGDRVPALRRLVTERRAAVVRALKAQAADAA